ARAPSVPDRAHPRNDFSNGVAEMLRRAARFCDIRRGKDEMIGAAAGGKQTPGLAAITCGEHDERIAARKVDPDVAAVGLPGTDHPKAVARVDPCARPL